MPRTARTPKKDWAPAFLAALEDTHLVTESCKRAGVGRSTVYQRRDHDAEFAQAWADVEERSTEILEQIAVRRAANGSDTLLIFLLKARRPSVYREQHRIEHVGRDGGPIGVKVDLDKEGREALANVLRGRPATSED